MADAPDRFDDGEQGPDKAPRCEPLTYPGAWPGESVLVTREVVAPIFLPAGERVSSGRVRRAGRLVDEPQWPGGSEPMLRDVLTMLNVAPSARRVPVLAIGSNASPAQLRNKALEQHFPLVVPMFLAEVSGLRVGYSAFISQYGYIPATFAIEPGASTSLFVQFLDDQQLRALDATETGYRRVWLPSDQVQVRLPSGEVLAGVYGYASEGGYLVRDQKMIPCGRQADILNLVRAASPALGKLLGRSPEEAARRAVAAGSGRSRINEAMAQAGLIGSGDQFTGALWEDQRTVGPRRYADILPVGGIDGHGQPWEPGTVTVRPSADSLPRGGQSIVALPDEVMDGLGRPAHVLVRSYAHRAEPSYQHLGVVAAVVGLDAVGDRPDEAERLGGAPCAQVDEVIRIALGLDVGDLAVISAARVERLRWIDWILGRPNHVMLRVNLADTTTTERPVCLMTRLTLELLGVASGDDVVLEGYPDPDGNVPRLNVKAFEVPSEVADERHRVMGGSWGSRFPSPRHTIGANPDIAEIFVDAASRGLLGLNGQQMGVIRARPARGQSFLAELRELMLVFVIAAVGIIGLVNDPAISFSLLAGLVLVALTVVLVRLRTRLSHDRTTRHAHRADGPSDGGVSSRRTSTTGR